MKYYSEKLNRLFDNAEECQKAEFEAKEKENREKIRKEREEREAKEKKEKLAAERKARAAEVQDARKAMITVQKKYQELLEAFIKDYKSYHLSLTGDDARDYLSSITDFFQPFFSIF